MASVLRGNGANLNNPSRRARHVLAVNTRYDYFKNPAQSVGGQSVEIGINSRWPIGSRGYAFGPRYSSTECSSARSMLQEPVWGPAPMTSAWRWCPVGVRVRPPWRAVRPVFGQLEYIHAVSGASADHIVDFQRHRSQHPDNPGIRHRRTHYRLSPYQPLLHRTERRAELPEARLLLVWTKAGGFKL